MECPALQSTSFRAASNPACRVPGQDQALLRVVAFALLSAALLPGATYGRSGRSDTKQRPGAEPELLRGTQAKNDSKWDGPQALAADRKGEVLVLRGDSWTASPLESDEKVQKLAKEGAAKIDPEGAFVRAAAVGGNGPTWVVLDLATVRLFRGGAELPVPNPEWQVHWVSMVDGDPVAVTLPFKMRMQKGETLEKVSLVLKWNEDEWSTLVEDDPISEADNANRHDLRQKRAAVAAGGSKGRIWVANVYDYRIRHFSAGGRLLLDGRILEGTAGPLVSPETEVERVEAILDEIERQGSGTGARVSKITASANTAEQLIFEVGEGPDGRLYLLTRDTDGGGGRLSIDRFDPALGLLERVAINVRWEGWSRLAVGTDGIFVAPFNASSGERRFFSWEELEAASWRVVPRFEISSRSQSRDD